MSSAVAGPPLLISTLFPSPTPEREVGVPAETQPLAGPEQKDGRVDVCQGRAEFDAAERLAVVVDKQDPDGRGADRLPGRVEQLAADVGVAVSLRPVEVEQLDPILTGNG